MDDDMTEQVLDMLLKNSTLKRKVQPILIGWVCFNIIILCLLLFIIYKLNS
jgi:hypothetical protein